jgi:superfamily II RNA helicase
MSDQNLELVPDYEQRVEVLKELKFLEANSTVSLKGRVACEVSCPPVFQTFRASRHLDQFCQ